MGVALRRQEACQWGVGGMLHWGCGGHCTGVVRGHCTGEDVAPGGTMQRRYISLAVCILDCTLFLGGRDLLGM